jgi:hypothetical protein
MTPTAAPTKTKKQSGYLITLEWFVQADLADIALLAKVQDCHKKAAGSFDVVGAEVDLTKSSVAATRR